MKILLWLATLVFFLLSWWWYVCPHKEVCPFGQYATSSQVIEETTVQSGEVSADNKAETARVHGPIVFDWSSDSPITSPHLNAFRDSIIRSLGPTNILEITGLYYNDEANETSAIDLGLARASQIRELFSDLGDERIQLKSNMASGGVSDQKEYPFAASAFRKVIHNEAVKEIQGRMVIHFPYASDEMLDNPKLHEYLDDLVLRLKSTDERVHLVGHTDNTAGSARNMSLGHMRANAIKNLLINKGLQPSRISTESKGETDPISTNDNPEGRRQNRRVELTIIS